MSSNEKSNKFVKKYRLIKFIKSKDVMSVGIKTIIVMFMLSIIFSIIVCMISMSKDTKISFLGSLFSGLIGGMGTLIAVLITVKEERNKQYESKRPILMLVEQDAGSKYIYDYRYYVGAAEEKKLYLNEIKNVGLGIARKIEIIMKVEDRESKVTEGTEEKFVKSIKNIIAPGDSLRGVTIDPNAPLYITSLNLNYKEPLEIHYEDTFGNKYITKYKLEIFELDRIYHYAKIEEVLAVGEEDW